MRFPGVIPAVTTPFDAHGEVDLEALKGNARSLLDAGLTGLVGNGTMGEAGSLSAAERRTVIEALVDAAGGRATVTAGVSAQNPEAAVAYARDAAAAGAGAVMLLPPLLYGGDEREVLAFFAAVAATTDLPIMAYNNPVASGGRPAAGLRCGSRGGRGRRRGQGVLGRRAPDPRVAAPRLATSRCSWAATTGRSRASPPAPPAGSPAWRTSRPRSASRSTSAVPRRRARRARATIYARMLPLARLDMTPKLVQYFKAAQDARRPRRRPVPRRRGCALTAEERAALDAALGALRGRRSPLESGARTSPPSTRTRRACRPASITGGVGPLPGATMLERKLHFEAEHGRPAAAADARAARPRRDVRGDPAAADARRTPTGACSSSRSPGCLPMCGHGTIGVATVLVETGHGRGDRAGDGHPARHARRPGRGARGGERRRARRR